MGFATKLKAVRDNLITYMAASAASFTSDTINYGLPRTDLTFPYAILKVISVAPENLISSVGLIKYIATFALIVVIDATGVMTTDEDSLIDKVGELVDILDVYAASGVGDWDQIQMTNINFGWDPTSGNIDVGRCTVSFTVEWNT